MCGVLFSLRSPCFRGFCLPYYMKFSRHLYVTNLNSELFLLLQLCNVAKLMFPIFLPAPTPMDIPPLTLSLLASRRLPNLPITPMFLPPALPSSPTNEEVVVHPCTKLYQNRVARRQSFCKEVIHDICN